jgi:hypothetical protein
MEKKIFLLAAMLICTSAVFSHTIIVDINGGGQFTSIQTAITNSSSGDTIKVWPGTYNEQITINKDILLEGSGYENSIITSTSDPTVNLINGKIKWFLISSLAGNGLKCSGGFITNCIVKGCVSRGIYTNSGTTLIYNSIFTNNSREGVYSDCGGNLIVVNCISYGNVGTGFSQYVNYYGCWAGFSLSYSNGSTSQYISGTGNINADPHFYSGSDYHISQGGDCWNTGNPSIQDPDGSVSDMGYFGGPDCPIYPTVFEMIITPNGNNVNIEAKGRANY